MSNFTFRLLQDWGNCTIEADTIEQAEEKLQQQLDKEFPKEIFIIQEVTYAENDAKTTTKTTETIDN